MKNHSYIRAVLVEVNQKPDIQSGVTMLTAAGFYQELCLVLAEHNKTVLPGFILGRLRLRWVYKHIL